MAATVTNIRAKTVMMAVSTDLSTDERVFRMANALHNAGYAVRVVGRERLASAPLLARAYAQQRLSMWFGRGFIMYAELNVRLVWALFRANSAILVANDMDTLPTMTLLAWLRRLPLAFDAHEYFSQVPELQHRPRTRRFWHWLEGWLIPKADVCYTVGPALAERFSMLYGKPFASILNVPATTLAPSSLVLRTPCHVIYVGALNQGRGLEALLQALTKLPRYIATIVGYGDIEPQLHTLAATLGISSQVVFTGNLTRDEYLPLLATASVGYSLLEPIGVSYQYSLSNKFFEYLAAGLPQLYPDLPEYMRLTSGHTIGLALPVSAEAIAEALTRLEDADVYGRMAAAAAELSQCYTWAQEERKLIGLYEALDTKYR